MAIFRNSLERRLWLAAGGLLAAIYLTLAWVRPISEALRSWGLLRATMIGIFVAVAAVAGWALARTRPGWREVAVLAPFAVFYVAVLSVMEQAEEAFHFVQYGAFAALVYAALAARRPERDDLVRPALGAMLVTAVAGWIDEGIQGLLPSRFYDLRDVGFNALAGVIASAAITAWRRTRRRGSVARSVKIGDL